MRLTLRTLLAYMDDILEPADHEDLGKKIEASDFATELIHRSRDTVRRLRLGAPAVFSDGSDDVLDAVDLGDANAVAEYLDNTLPPEQVAEFERMCLEPGNEADMHLAEVASCHHVLTMVLGEPAEVDANLKARMYQLPEQLANGQKLRIEPAHTPPPEQPQTAPPVEVATPAAPPKPQPASTMEPELPDYLREAAAAKRRSRRWAIAMTLLAVGAIGAWLASTPEADPPSVVAEMDAEEFDDGEIEIQGLDISTDGDSSTSSATDSGTATTEAPPFNPGITANTGDTAEVEAPPFVPDMNAGAAEAPPFQPDTDVQPAAEVRPGAETVEAMDDGQTNDGPAVNRVIDPESPADMEIGNSAVVDVEIGEPADVVSGEGATASMPATDTASLPDAGAVALPDAESAMSDAADAAATNDPVLIASTPEAPMPSELTTATDDEPTVVEDPEPTGPQRLGNYLGNNDVLLVHDAAQDHWVRMPPRSPISTGDELLTLPKFFTHVVLADVNTYLSGGTRIRIPVEVFEAATGESDLNIEVVYGRVMLNSGLNGTKISIQVGDQLREFELSGSSSLAVDVQRMFVPGNDYENQAAPIKATWYLTSGSVEWPTAAGGSQTVQGQMKWQTIEGIDEIPEQLPELPEWIGREPMTDMERSASLDIAKELKAGWPVGIRLLELTDGKGLGRRKEVRVLAAASSVFVGEFEPLVKALNDSDQNRAWNAHIEELRQSVALSPDVASSVRQAFVNTRGEDAASDLMEMVMGYSLSDVGESRDAIQTGALSQLLKWLDHDSLDYRVLAIYNIREITGKTKGYRADDSPKGRKKNLRKIWAEFEANELLPSA